MKQQSLFLPNLKIRAAVLPLLVAGLLLGGCDSDGDKDVNSEGGNQSGNESGATGGTAGSGGEGDAAGSGDTDPAKVIFTVSSDITSSALEIYNVTAPRNGVTGANPGVSDTIVRSFEDRYFVIRRYLSDSIAAYATNDSSSLIFESSTNDGVDPASSNPHDMIFVNSQKAYLLRYGSPIAWIVNPSAADASQFKIGELDLSAYDPDGVPEMTRGVVVNDRLFVFMQRLDSFAPTRPGYVAVIDTANDTEIDTGSSGELKGIELPAFNPWDITVDSATDTIFLAAAGDFGFAPRPAAYTGGIVTVDTQDFSTNLLIDDSDDTGRTVAVEVFDTNTAYMISQADFGSSSLVKFNPATGAILDNAVAGYSGIDLRDLAKGPAGNLWLAIGDIENPKVVVLNPADGTEAADAINTTLIPTGITFTR